MSTAHNIQDPTKSANTDEDDETEVFEIVDYTNASPWERFTADLESAFVAVLGSPGNDDPFPVQAFDGHEYAVRLYENTRPAQTFSPDGTLSTPLHYWTGESRFILLDPLHGYRPTDLGVVKKLLSSVGIAAWNSKVRIPIMLPIGAEWRQIYAGVACSGTLTRRFKTTHLSFVPTGCDHLVGLLDVFSDRFNIKSTEDVEVASRIMFTATNFDEDRWRSGFLVNEDARFNLELGPRFDPVDTLHLFKETDFIASNIALQEEVFQTAENHRTYIRMTTDNLDSNTPAIVGLQLSRCLERVVDGWIFLHSSGASDSRQKTLGHALLTSVSKRNGEEGATIIESRDIFKCIRLIFAPSMYRAVPKPEKNTESFLSAFELASQMRYSSGTPYLSILWNLCIVSVQFLQGQRGHEHFIPSIRVLFGSLWSEFVRALRIHWENRIPIPGISFQPNSDRVEFASNGKDFSIDTRYNLLTQKLEMLNCAIVSLNSREHTVSRKFQDLYEPLAYDAKTDAMHSNMDESGEESETSDIFFDAAEDAKDIDSRHVLPGVVSLSTGLPIRIPETQNGGLATTDMIEEMQEIYEKLGTSEEAAKIRAKMQSAQLRSDMEAFKAANPDCVLEDFVRWHSPRDWLVSEKTGAGTLSARMIEPGNLWKELWSETEPIPVSQQKPLFDALQEGEKALHWLEQLTAKDVVSFLIPSIFLVAYDTLLPNIWNKETIPCELCKFQGVTLENLASRLQHLAWSAIAEGDLDRAISLLYDAIGVFRTSESACALIVSLSCKLRGTNPIVGRLINHFVDMTESDAIGEILLDTETWHASVLPLFKRANEDLNQNHAKSKEYVLRHAFQRDPIPNTLKRFYRIEDLQEDDAVYERMYCEVSESLFRLFEVHATQ